MVGNHSIVNHWKCGSPQRCVLVPILSLCRKSLLKVTSKYHKHQHWKFHLFFWRTALPVDCIRVSLENRETRQLCLLTAFVEGQLLKLLVVQTVFTCKQDRISCKQLVLFLHQGCVCLHLPQDGTLSNLM